jgi:hypothetical protein
MLFIDESSKYTDGTVPPAGAIKKDPAGAIKKDSVLPTEGSYRAS